jgi:integration host factor subunit beta
VTKSELIAALAARYSQLAARDTDYAVKTVLDAMTQALAEGQRIEIRGFGSFSLSERAPRIGRNPKSGEQVLVPGKQVPHFKAGKELRERVDLNATESDLTPGVTQVVAPEVDLGASLVARHAVG